jgi:large subunit ribosomal protein L25
MEQLALTAQLRKEHGKGAARKMRRENRMPAVFYGPNAEPVSLTVDIRELEKIMRQTTSENIFLELRIDANGGSEKRTVILKELQVHPLSRRFYHADFYEIPMDKELNFQIPIHFVNTPVGASKGGVLEQTLRELSVTCLPTKLVDRIDVDVSGLDVGGSLHVRDIPMPEGIKTSLDPDQTIAVLAVPVVKAAEPEGEEEAKEGEEAAATPEAPAE